MRVEEVLNPDPATERFNNMIHQSVQRFNFRPYSRRGVDNNCDWDRDREYHRINCYMGDTTYKVYTYLLTLI